MLPNENYLVSVNSTFIDWHGALSLGYADDNTSVRFAGMCCYIAARLPHQPINTQTKGSKKDFFDIGLINEIFIWRALTCQRIHWVQNWYQLPQSKCTDYRDGYWFYMYNSLSGFLFFKQWIDKEIITWLIETYF